MRKADTTTAAVLNSQARKHANKLKRDELQTQEAARLGVSVTQLLQQKALEGEVIRAKSAKENIHIVKVGPPVYQQEQENEHHGWDPLFKRHYL
jgi:hypothetical protein